MESYSIPIIIQTERLCTFYCYHFINRYTLKLVNNPSYEKEIFPNDLSKCSYINEWITREIEVLMISSF